MQPAAIHLVTFYSQGAPHDGGLPLTQAAQALCDAAAPHVDSCRAFSWAEVAAEVGAAWDASHAAASNPGYHAVGFGAFKPCILLRALAAAQDGEVVVYRDGNVAKYPQYLEGLHLLRATVAHVFDALGPGCDVWMPAEDPGALRVRHHCKAHVLRELAHDKVAAIGEQPLLNAAVIFVRKTRAAEALLAAWAAAMARPDLAPNRPDPAPHPEFRWHTHDQAVLNVLLYDWYLGSQPAFPAFWYPGRLLTANNLLRFRPAAP